MRRRGIIFRRRLDNAHGKCVSLCDLKTCTILLSISFWMSFEKKYIALTLHSRTFSRVKHLPHSIPYIIQSENLAALARTLLAAVAETMQLQLPAAPLVRLQQYNRNYGNQKLFRRNILKFRSAQCLISAVEFHWLLKRQWREINAIVVRVLWGKQFV